MTLVSMVVSVASLRYVSKILLELIKAYDLIHREQVMAVVDEENTVGTAGMVEALLQSSTVMTARDETKLKNMIKMGLTQGGPASPALKSKTANVRI